MYIYVRRYYNNILYKYRSAIPNCCSRYRVIMINGTDVKPISVKFYFGSQIFIWFYGTTYCERMYEYI